MVKINRIWWVKDSDVSVLAIPLICFMTFMCSLTVLSLNLSVCTMELI